MEGALICEGEGSALLEGERGHGLARARARARTTELCCCWMFLVFRVC